MNVKYKQINKKKGTQQEEEQQWKRRQKKIETATYQREKIELPLNKNEEKFKQMQNITWAYNNEKRIWETANKRQSMTRQRANSMLNTAIHVCLLRMKFIHFTIALKMNALISFSFSSSYCSYAIRCFVNMIVCMMACSVSVSVCWLLIHE